MRYLTIILLNNTILLVFIAIVDKALL